jgi:hypothetical protein
VLIVQLRVFVPITLSTEPQVFANQFGAVAAAAEIRMELRRGTSSVTVMWPKEMADACGAWLREWLR